jgi:hypothetical protein
MLLARKVDESAHAGTGVGRTVDERLAQCIWYDGMLTNAGLKTLSGKPLEILDPGRWNEEGGPDFRMAEVRIANKPIKGDIEIHLNSSDWEGHNHHRNFEYNTVVLHAFLRRADKKTYDVLHNGDPLERFEMGPYLFPDLETIRRTISAEDYPYSSKTGVGRCAELMTAAEEEFVRTFLDLAGTERMEEKIRRFRDQLHGENFQQVFYQALMTSMGYKGSKTLFFLLSKRVPLSELLDYTRGETEQTRRLMIQSILLHVANLVPQKDIKHPFFDNESMEYINQLNRYWAEFSGYFADRIIPPDRKWFAKVRPVNFATRRVAGMSHIIVRHSGDLGLFGTFATWVRQEAERSHTRKTLLSLIRQLQQTFVLDVDDYWTYRYLFTTKKAARPMSLIGSSKALSVVFNALLPLLILKMRQDKDQQGEAFCWQLFSVFPRLSSNVVVKFMSHRLFGDHSRGRMLLTTERRQQALFRIFHDCCNNNEVSCADCTYLRAMNGKST